MKKDRFEDVVRALREEGAPAPDDVRRVRRRVLETLAQPAAKRRRLSPWLLPIAATLAATTALAATGTLTAVVKAIVSQSEEAPPAPAPAPTQTKAKGNAPAKPAEQEAKEEEKKEEEKKVEEEAPTPTPTPTATATATATATPTANPRSSVRTPAPAPAPAAAPASASAPTPAAAPAPSAPADDAERRELSSYRSAHTLHFTAKNYAAALSAWDSYLSAFPAGALAHEARYNRAICLLELGRTGEAASALKPFANGSVAGGYRKTEARSLLEVMDAGK